jgi:D-alanyl-D-alanine carboxypeptidase
MSSQIQTDKKPTSRYSNFVINWYTSWYSGYPRQYFKDLIMHFVRYLILVILLSCLAGCGSGSESNQQTPTPVDPTPTPPPTTPATPDKQTQLQDILNSAITGSNTPGLVMAITDDSNAFVLASGTKDAQAQTAITTEDSLRIASMTKLLVATVVVKLAEEGKLALDGLMADYLDAQSINAIANYDQVTIRQLLNMSSGIVDYTAVDAFNDAVDDNPTRVWQQQEVLAYIHNLDADFAPGADWNYSNSNYVLLDLVVGAVGNSSLAQEMRRIIFTPLAMESSYLEFRENSAADGSQLSVSGFEGNEEVTNINDGIGFGDGGVVSTAADLSDFIDALFGQKSLLSQASLDDMLTEIMSQEYGLGAEIRTTTDGTAWGHNGSSSGFSGEILYFRDKCITFILLSNQADNMILEQVMTQSLAVMD